METTDNFEELLELCRKGQANICADSRNISQGDIFVAIPVLRKKTDDDDEKKYIADAIAGGATHIVSGVHSYQTLAALHPQIRWTVVAEPRLALSQLAAAFYGTEHLPFRLIGLTGTNGKTTCAWLLEHFFKFHGFKTALLGTVEYHWPGYRQSAPLTTPGSLELHRMLAAMKDAGTQVAIMEVSSHALAQNRVGSLEFDGAIFTNLTQDHLDYHKNMESYFQAKARLFLQLPRSSKVMAINNDDPYGRRLLELVPSALSYGMQKRLPDVRHLAGEVISATPTGMTLGMNFGSKRWRLNTRLIGAFNAANLLAAQALALESGFESQDMRAFETFTGVPGRLERVENPHAYNIFVDYAHTPDALSNVLRTLRAAGFDEIITVFGCGGNRDAAKRPLMGQAVAENSDIAILTSDNPRMEDPEAIMADVKPGLARAARVICEVDRREATCRALRLATRSNAVLIAGKGHEDYQIIGAQKRHYSDKEVVREFLGCE